MCILSNENIEDGNKMRSGSCRRHVALGLAATLVVLASGRGAAGAEALVAVAANFLEPLEKLAPLFLERSGHAIKHSGGSTGQFYSQIKGGAPYDVFLSADDVHPRLLENEGLAVGGTRFTYAVGRLALWSADARRVGADGAAVLRSADFRRLAIANPELAPYGDAARQTLQALGLWPMPAEKLVQGQNIGQTFQFVATKNAELGFVALSQVVSPRNADRGSHWVVPQTLHKPIRQDAALLMRGRENPAARAFLEFLRDGVAVKLIVAYGYAFGD
jgi:molybdate transport system substrate-binding protein